MTDIAKIAAGLNDDYYEDHECANCGGEGFVTGCSWDWQCDTYDEGEGTCLCLRRCEWCNPAKLTDEQIKERDDLLPPGDSNCEHQSQPGPCSVCGDMR